MKSPVFGPLGRGFAAAAFCFFLTITPSAAAPPTILWERHLNDDWAQSSDVIVDLAVDRSGDVWAIGSGTLASGETMSSLAKFDAAGTLKAAIGTGLSTTRVTRGVAVTVERTGTALSFANATAPDGSVLPIFLKLSPEGDILYAPFLNLPANTSVEVVAVTLGADDAAFVAFNHTRGATSGVVKKFPANSAPDDLPAWETTLSTPPGVSVRLAAIALDPSGNVIVAGQALLPGAAAGVAPGNEPAAYLTASLAPDGTQNWLRLHQPPASPLNRVTALTTDSAGAVYVTGVAKSAHDATLTAALTVKYLTDGTESWAKAFDATEQASESLGHRSFAGACLLVDNYLWVGCRPFALLRHDVANGDLSAYSYYSVDDGIEATLDRIIGLEQNRGLLVAGSFDDGTPGGSLMVQHVDHSLNDGWSQRISPNGAAASELADFVRGKGDRLFVGASSELATPPPATDGAIIALAPPAVPTVNVVTLMPLAIEPVRDGGFALSGRFRIFLSSPAEQDMTIYYHLEGTANSDVDSGADYVAPPNMGHVIIAAGNRHADVVIRPLADRLREPVETIRLVINPTNLPTLNDYKIGPSSKAIVYLFDRTPFSPLRRPGGKR